MQFLSPTSVEDAVQMLAAQSGGCSILAGGTDLLVRMRSGFSEPDAVMDIKRIDDLRRITVGGRRLAHRRGRFRRRNGGACRPGRRLARRRRGCRT